MTFATAVLILFTMCIAQIVLVGYSRHKKKTKFIGGMELVSLRCNRDFTSASSYGLGWYKYAFATQWYQFHTTDAWWFSLNMQTNSKRSCQTADDENLLESALHYWSPHGDIIARNAFSFIDPLSEESTGYSPHKVHDPDISRRLLMELPQSCTPPI